jgi:hypothetical protein
LSKVTEFCRLARAGGLAVGIRESADACRVADLWLFRDFPAFHAGLRSLLARSPEDIRRFEVLFTAYWLGRKQSGAGAKERDAAPQEEESGAEALWRALGYRDSQAADAEEEARESRAASAMAVLRRTDFADVPDDRVADLEQLALRLWRRMSLPRKRRLRALHGKEQLNLRRSLRRNVGRGGELVDLVYSGRKRRKPRLLVLLDVSRSMNLYSFFLLRLVYVLQHRFRRVHSFLFSTGLVEVTPALSEQELSAALERLSTRPVGWNGGTRIGECLARLHEEHGRRVLRPDTDVIVLSDGWDAGPPEALATALRRIRRRCRRIIWLNPLLGLPGYEPVTAAMQAALPLIDVFAPAHSVDSLLDFARGL